MTAPPAQANQVVGLTLVNAATDQDIRVLANGDSINLAVSGTSLNIRADVDGPVGSVRFALDGSDDTRTENSPPYSLAGDADGDYAPWTPTLGGHRLTATPFSGPEGTGAVGLPLTIEFTAINAPLTNQPPVLVAGPQASRNPLTLPAATTVGVTASDPNSDPLTYAWSMAAGPGTATFSNSEAAGTTVSFSAPGDYTLQVAVSDGQAATTGSLSVTVVSASPTDGAVVVSGELKRWHKATLTLDGPFASEGGSPNPFLDYRMDVTFTNGSLAYTVPGYFAADGDAANTSATSGNKWRAHLSPDLTGTWSYTIRFRQGPDAAVQGGGTALPPYDGLSGSFAVAETDKTGRDLRGKGRLGYVGRHHLRFAGTGEYFLKSGADSPENFLAYADFDNTPDVHGLRKTWEAHRPDWQAGDPAWKNGLGKGIIGAVNYLSGKGMNALSFLTMSVLGDDQNVFMWASPADPRRYDCSKLDQWEIVLSHAHAAGMFLHFKTQEYENDRLLDGGDLGPTRRLYFRELIARFGHHLALNWNLGEENQQTDAQRKAMCDYIRGLDPYDHLIVVHSEPQDIGPTYTPLLGYPTLDGASLQTAKADAHATTLDWVRQSAAAGRPWVVSHDEMLYGAPHDGIDYAHDEVRKEVLWGSLMAGGAGVEYYFGWGDPQFDDLTCQDFRTRARLWDLSRHALEFFSGNAIPFWEMTNGDELTPGLDDYVLYKPGKVYLVYLKNGGGAYLNLFNVGGTFEVKWFDPQNGGSLSNGTEAQVNGGALAFLGLPPYETARDWVALVRTRPPDPPVLIAPSDNAAHISRTPTLSVVVTDPDNDAMTVSCYGRSTNSPSPEDFARLGSAASVASGATASFVWAGLDPGTEYEWYVTLSDVDRTTTGPIWSFTTLIDADGDGIPNHLEAGCLDPYDDDSDDDGILDGSEDANRNGLLDPGETDPCRADTDGDGIKDGTEIGLTAPQGRGTDSGAGGFFADADPSTATDPLRSDSDFDGVPDGEEDANRNGRVDPGENDPLAYAACPPGLAALYRLDEAAGPFEDELGGPAGACTTCPAAAAGRVGNAQRFNGIDTGIDVADDGRFNWDAGQGFAIAFWFKTAAAGPGDRAVIGRTDAASGLNWWVGLKNGCPFFQLEQSGGAGVSVGGAAVLSDDQWHHVAAVRDGALGENRLYVDGALTGTPAPFNYTSDFRGTAPVNVGHLNSGARYEGLVDEVGIYDRSLAPAEIQKQYRNGLAGKGGCDAGPVFTALGLKQSIDKVGWEDVDGSLAAGFGMRLAPAAEYHYLDVSNDPVDTATDRPIHPGYYGFNLVAHPPGFLEYWGSRGVDPSAAAGSWQAHMWQIITGAKPMFYLRVSAAPGYMLVDGLQRDYLPIGVEDFLRVNGGYPLGRYRFMGTLEDTFAAESEIAVEMTFQPGPVPDLDGDGDVDGSDLAECIRADTGAGLADLAANFGKSAGQL